MEAAPAVRLLEVAPVPVDLSGIDGRGVVVRPRPRSVTAANPSTVNSNPASNNVVILSQLTNSPVLIPGYSVVRLEWVAFTLTPPRLSIAAANGQQDLAWLGQTNIIYDVEAATNLAGTWATLGRIAATQTNVAFTNWNQGPKQFYQLLVP